MEARTFVFIVTQSCQLRCKYCYLVGKNDSGRMNLDTAQKAIDYILSEKRLQDCDRAIFDFIGGEPLLEIDLIEQIVSYIKYRLDLYDHIWKNNFIIKLTTNGILYGTKKVQDFIKQYKDILSISISIDGEQTKHDLNRVFENGEGSYSKIIDNVFLWRKQFTDVGTKMVLSHDDLPYVKKSLMHLLNLGIKNIDVNPCVEDVWQVGDGNILETQLIEFADYIIENDLWEDSNITCFHEYIGTAVSKDARQTPCGGMTLAVDSNGNFFNCMRFANYSLREKNERIIGNVNIGIDWNKMRPFYLLYTDIVYPSQCLKCDIANGCKWCPAENYDSSSTSTIFQRSTALCEVHKAIVRAKNYYWNKLYYHYK